MTAICGINILLDNCAFKECKQQPNFNYSPGGYMSMHYGTVQYSFL